VTERKSLYTINYTRKWRYWCDLSPLLQGFRVCSLKIDQGRYKNNQPKDSEGCICFTVHVHNPPKGGWDTGVGGLVVFSQAIGSLIRTHKSK
jgi:hypothetical protein